MVFVDLRFDCCNKDLACLIPFSWGEMAIFDASFLVS